MSKYLILIVIVFIISNSFLIPSNTELLKIHEEPDTNAIYLASLDSLHMESESGNDTVFEKVYCFVRFFSNKKCFISDYFTVFPDENIVNKFDAGFKGHYRIKKNGKIKIVYNTGNPYSVTVRVLVIIHSGKLIFEKENIGYGPLFLWRKLKGKDKETYEKNINFNLYSKPDW